MCLPPFHSQIWGDFQCWFVSETGPLVLLPDTLRTDSLFNELSKSSLDFPGKKTDSGVPGLLSFCIFIDVNFASHIK